MSHRIVARAAALALLAFAAPALAEGSSKTPSKAASPVSASKGAKVSADVANAPTKDSIATPGHHRVFRKFSVASAGGCHYDGVIDGMVETLVVHGQGARYAPHLAVDAAVICPKGDPQKVTTKISGGKTFAANELESMLASVAAIRGSKEGCRYAPKFAVAASLAPTKVTYECDPTTATATGGGPADPQMRVRTKGAPTSVAAPASAKRGKTGTAVVIATPSTHVGRAEVPKPIVKPAPVAAPKPKAKAAGVAPKQ